MIEYRSLGRLVFLIVITLGLYAIFWFYWVSKEMLAYNGRTGYPGLWILAIGLSSTIPFIYAIPIWKFAEQVSLTSRGRYSRLFLFVGGLLIIFIPVIVLLTQRLLNEIALEQRAQMAAGPMDTAQPGEPQADEERSGGDRPDEEPPDDGPPPGPGGDEPGDEPDDPYVESEDIRTIGR